MEIAGGEEVPEMAAGPVRKARKGKGAAQYVYNKESDFYPMTGRVREVSERDLPGMRLWERSQRTCFESGQSYGARPYSM